MTPLFLFISSHHFFLCRAALCRSSCRGRLPKRAPATTLRASRGRRPSGNSSPANVFTSWISWWFWKRWLAQQKHTQTHRQTQRNPEERAQMLMKVSGWMRIVMLRWLCLSVCLSACQLFSATLSSLQMKNCLADVDSWRLFANLNELCLVRPRADKLWIITENYIQLCKQPTWWMIYQTILSPGKVRFLLRDTMNSLTIFFYHKPNVCVHSVHVHTLR